MSDYLDVTQMFAIGIGLEIAGAYLLARGLLVTNEEIARRTSTYIGANPWATVSEISDRADAKIGVGALLCGFVVQAAAYVATLATELGGDANVRKAVVAAIAVVLAAGAVFAVVRVVRPRLMKSALVDIASIDEDGVKRLPYPRGQRLGVYARALGFRPKPAEDQLSFFQRVFGVEDVLYGEAPDFQRGTELRRQRALPTAES